MVVAATIARDRNSFPFPFYIFALNVSEKPRLLGWIRGKWGLKEKRVPQVMECKELLLSSFFFLGWSWKLLGILTLNRLVWSYQRAVLREQSIPQIKILSHQLLSFAAVTLLVFCFCSLWHNPWGVNHCLKSQKKWQNQNELSNFKDATHG